MMVKGHGTPEDARIIDMCRDLMTELGNVAGWSIQRDHGEPDRITVRLYADPALVDLAMRGEVQPEHVPDIAPPHLATCEQPGCVKLRSWSPETGWVHEDGTPAWQDAHA